MLTPRWKRVLAVLAPVWATVFGAAMAVQWELGGSGAFEDGPLGAATVGRWMADTLPLMEAGEPRWWWRGPFFLCLVALLPFVWAVTSRVPSAAARWCTRGGLLVAAGAIGLEYSTPGYGWLFDLVALLVALGGTVACGVSALRHRALPRRLAWSLISVLPLTPPAKQPAQQTRVDVDLEDQRMLSQHHPSSEQDHCGSPFGTTSRRPPMVRRDLSPVSFIHRTASAACPMAAQSRPPRRLQPGRRFKGTTIPQAVADQC